MKTIAERTTHGVVYRSPKTCSIPDLDILTLLFDSEQSLASPDTPIHISAADPSHVLTISRARILTEATSASLRKHFGIGANGAGKDVCSVISTGHYLLPVLAYGVIGAGGVYSAASASSTASELSKQILGAGSKILITCEETKETAVRAAETAGWGSNGGGRVLVMSEGRDWTVRVVEENGELGPNLFDEKERLTWQRITDPHELENGLIVLIYSSGTTGLPKGVKLSHRNTVAQAVATGDMMKSWAADKRPDFAYRTLAHLPSSHIAGLQVYFFNPLYLGGQVYWMPKFNFTQFLEYNKKYRVTYFVSVPPIYLLIAKSTEVTDQFQTLEMAVSTAAPMGKDLQHAASQKLGGRDCFIDQLWGLSETTGAATFMLTGTHDDTGSVGPLIPNMLARIIDDNGRDVEPGKPGEMLIKGPCVFKGYYQNEAADKESFTGEWFRTGDIAEFRNGLFYIVDRKKELIKYKGLQVAPAELEALLITHPDILDAAVIGVETDDGHNEVPRAYVVADKKKISGQDIAEYVKKNAGSHKQLRGGVVFVDEIPKSPSGKILRKDLRILAKREKGARL